MVNVTRRLQMGVAALVAGMTLTTAAQANGNAPDPHALGIRSQAMNEKYNLDALNALQIRSDALNQRYQLGVNVISPPTRNTAALGALAIRGRAMNQRYQLGSYAIIRQSSKGFSWADATVGGAAVFGLILIGGGAAVAARRLRGKGLTPA
jgi:hypothetical protein